MRILSGLSAGDRIGINVPVELEEGNAVQPVDAKKTPSGGASEKSGANAQPPSDADQETSTREKALSIRHGEQKQSSEVGTPAPRSSAK